MYEFIVGILIVLIIIIGRIIVFGRATWKLSMLYGITFIAIYITFQLDIRYNYNIKLLYYKIII
ncbi:MAG: hypothetical protein WHV26_11535, partial [Spirochaetota bacterium]